MDLDTFEFIQRLAGESHLFDRIISNLTTNPILKGTPPMLLFWAIWFSEARNKAWAQSQLLATLAVAAIAIGIGRVLASVLPFRLRPLHTADVEMQLSFDLDPSILSGWSAFPSDHAVMFFALASSFWIINRFYGALAFAHALVAIAFGRVFMGFHWPSDVVAGAIIGCGVSFLLLTPLTRISAKYGFAETLDRRPQLLYPSLFLVTYQVATMFDAGRELASSVWRSISIL